MFLLTIVVSIDIVPIYKELFLCLISEGRHYKIVHIALICSIKPHQRPVQNPRLGCYWREC